MHDMTPYKLLSGIHSNSVLPSSGSCLTPAQVCGEKKASVNACMPLDPQMPFSTTIKKNLCLI